MPQYDSLLQMLETFPNEQACVEHLEKLRWPVGFVCACCGSTRKIYRKKSKLGVYRCADCKKDFSIRKGTIYEESRISLRKWFIAAWLMTNHRKGISSHQLARELGVTQKTAWFVLARLRKAAESAGDNSGPMDGPTEVDETYLGGKEKNRHRSKRKNLGRGTVGKDIVLGARSRSGKVVAKRVEKASKKVLGQFIRRHVPEGVVLYTDDHKGYTGLGSEYRHKVVVHSVGEYVRNEAHTNGIESFWAMLKRGYYGVFHHFTWKHLDRYLAEFSFRWNLLGLSGSERLDALVSNSFNDQLTYRDLISG